MNEKVLGSYFECLPPEVSYAEVGHVSVGVPVHSGTRLAKKIVTRV